MERLLTHFIAVMLLTGMTAVVFAEDNNAGVAKAVPAVVTDVAHTSLAVHQSPRIGQISAQPAGRPVVILPGPSAPLSVDNGPAEMRK